MTDLEFYLERNKKDNPVIETDETTTSVITINRQYGLRFISIFEKGTDDCVDVRAERL